MKIAPLLAFVAAFGLGAGNGYAGSPTGTTVRVAAIQCASVMGATEANVTRLIGLVREAGRMGARVVVTPECAVQGYLYPPTWTGWSSAPDSGERSVRRVAEAVPGPSTARFAALSREHGLYICVGMIESDRGRFFNSQVLLAPDGSIVAHHRKKALWTPGDSAWCTEGDRPVQVVDTPFGRLGLMICFDIHVLPERLSRERADIVLYSVGWYGPNEDAWFRTQVPRRFVTPNGFHLVAANWTGVTAADEWPGRGHSCIIAKNGTVLAMAKGVVGSEIVVADLPVAAPLPATGPAERAPQPASPLR